MAGWTWAIVIVVIVAIVLVVVAAVLRQRRTARLQDRFGAEYERTVRARDDRQAAEAELRERESHRAQLDIRPLTAGTRNRVAAEWSELQGRFVDQPSAAVLGADALIRQVMSERGYPVDNFDAQAGLISVDHPELVQNFREAHRSYLRAQAQQASTEDLREALMRYRSLFDELLTDEPPGMRRDGGDHQSVSGEPR